MNIIADGGQHWEEAGRSTRTKAGAKQQLTEHGVHLS
jgi:hypothetical protein